MSGSRAEGARLAAHSDGEATVLAFSGRLDGPGMTDFVGRAKYDAWAAIKGKTKDDAMQEYVDLIESLK